MFRANNSPSHQLEHKSGFLQSPEISGPPVNVLELKNLLYKVMEFI